MNIIKRITAGVLSALTMVSSFPAVSAAPVIEQMEDGTFKFPIVRAEADNQASEAEIKPGETYVISDRGSRQATFLQNGETRNVWPMHSRLSDNTEFAVYCGDHTKGNPGDGMEFTVTERISDMRLYGVVTKSDARNTLAAFVGSANTIEDGAKEILSNPEFDEWCYFCASQAAIWTALGDVNIEGGNWDDFSWSSSESLGYHSGAGKSLNADDIRSSLTLYAATLMLKQGSIFNEIWGPGGAGHAPGVEGSFSYSKGKTEFDPAAKESGPLNLPKSVSDSGVFMLDTIDGQECYVLPMAATSATFVRAEQIFVALKDAPTGAFLIDSNGVKSGTDGRLTLHKAVRNDDLADNGNGQTWGETFKFCIPKSTAETMNANGETLQASLAASMSVDRYNVYIAEPPSDSVQPGILVEPAVQKILIQQEFSSQPGMPEEYVNLKIIKKDADDATKSLQGAKFKIEYMQNGVKEERTGTTGEDGTVTFVLLPLGAEVTITETEPPAGYKLMSPNPVTKTLPTTPGETGVAEYTLTDKPDTDPPDIPDVPDVPEPGDGELKIRKVDADTGANLAGASFRLQQIDGSFTTSVGPTGSDGFASIDGENLPNGSYKVTEINAPDGYVLNPEAQTFQWNNEEGQAITLTFKDYKKGALEILKYDAVTNKKLAGAAFDLMKDGKKIDSLITDATGHASKSGLTEGYYQLVEVNPPGGYLKDTKVYEVYIDPEDTAEVVKKVNTPNYQISLKQKIKNIIHRQGI